MKHNFFIFYLFILFPFIISSQEDDKFSSPNFNLDTLGIYENDLLSSQFHLERRKAIRNFMPENSMAIFHSGN